MGRRSPAPAAPPFDRTLPPRPSSVGVARALVRELLTTCGRDDLVDDAVLLVSEIVTNALIHAGSSIGVRGRLDPGGLRVEVSDASPHHPTPRGYADTAGTGRGLALMVDLVDDWGVSTTHGGKTVWFELRGGAGEEPDEHDHARQRGTSDDAGSAASRDEVTPRTSGRTGDAVHVQLLEVPLLLHEAWREHAETLLREYLLASLDLADVAAEPVDVPGSRADPIQVHAEATDAIAVLEEQIPVADIDLEPAKLMAQATEPDVTAPQLWIEVPQRSVPHFATLEQALDRALVLADAGLVMAPRTQPEIQAFRRWVCRQVRDQSTGLAPSPWSIDRETVRSTVPVRADAGLEEIAGSTECLIAADDTNQIVALSRSAGTLLGYDASEELIGQRLVAIIPPRFHQAHIAGFTLHRLVGRSPLLGREVEVPAQRRDGTEVTVRLEITSRSAPDGAIFVARMRPVAD